MGSWRTAAWPDLSYFEVCEDFDTRFSNPLQFYFIQGVSCVRKGLQSQYRIFMSLLQSLVMNDCGHRYFVEQADPGNRWCTADSVFRIKVASGFGGVCYTE